MSFCILCKCSYLEPTLILQPFTLWKKKITQLFSLIHKMKNCLGNWVLRSGGILCLWTSSLVWLSGGRGRAKDFLTPITNSARGNLAQGVIPAQGAGPWEPTIIFLGRKGWKDLKLSGIKLNVISHIYILLPAFYLPDVSFHLTFDTGTRPHLCLLKAHAWSDGLSEELALVRHHIAGYLAIQTQIPTQLHGVYVSSWYKGVPGVAHHSVCSAS